MIALPTFGDGAAARIGGHVRRTPVFTSRTLDGQLGAEVFCKVESLQRTGAYKPRGAVNAVLSLDDDAAARGVVTQSSGNHGAALAYAARIRGVRCHVAMPDVTPSPKVAAARGYGAEVVFCDREEREEGGERLRAATGAVPVYPYDDAAVIAGHGTAALELARQVPGLDVVIAPIGGGGLLASTAIVAGERMDGARVVEPSAAIALAAARRMAPTLAGARVGVILSGGNTDFAWLRGRLPG